MRFAAVTDIHGRVERVKKLAEVLKNEDLNGILIAGDITHFSGSEVAENVLSPLLELKMRIVAVHGNCDGRDVPEFLNNLGISAHNRRVEFEGVGIVGIGGSNITPFHTIWELTEEEIADILRSNYRDGDVILSHVPPKNTVADRVHFGFHVGSRALREFIEEKQPPLVICGHIHEGRGVDRVGKTVVLNPGPLFRGYYAVVDIKKNGVEVELKRI